MILRNLLLYLFLTFSCPVFAGQDSFAPDPGKTILFVGQDIDTIAQYVNGMGKAPGGTMFYTSIQEMKGLNQSNEYGSGPQYGDALLQYPDSAIQMGLYMVGGLDKTVAGMYDAHLLSLAQWLKKANRPVYLRIGYEFDNPSNHYDPDQYIQAFRHVVDFLRTQGVTNAAFVWHTYCSESSSRRWMDWYPGDDYVDWFGVSIFSTYQIGTAENFLKLAREHNKPFMIAESTPMGLYTVRGKLDWLSHIFHFIEDRNVEAFCYIDSDWDIMPMFQGQGYGDARLEVDPQVKDFWLNEIHQDRYLSSSPDLFESLGWTNAKT